jgi:hypothetical protein
MEIQIGFKWSGVLIQMRFKWVSVARCVKGVQIPRHKIGAKDLDKSRCGISLQLCPTWHGPCNARAPRRLQSSRKRIPLRTILKNALVSIGYGA